MDATTLERLCARFAPVLALHPSEPYRPVCVETLFAVGKLHEINNYDGDNNGKLGRAIGVADNTKAPRVLQFPDGDARASRAGWQPAKTGRNQLLCRPQGPWTRADTGERFMDLVYTAQFVYNGTRMSHPYDKEEVVVRVRPSGTSGEWFIARVFGSAHGNGMWWNTNELEFVGTHPFMYCSSESHAMYNTPGVKKRIFGFGNEHCSRDGEHWKPTEVVLYDGGPIRIVSVKTGVATPVTSPEAKAMYVYDGQVGRLNEDIQQMATASGRYTSTVWWDGFYHYQGGIASLFHGPEQKVPWGARIAALVLSAVAWVAFAAYLVWRNAMGYMDGEWSSKWRFGAFAGLEALAVVGLLVCGMYLGLELFVLNPP